MTVDDAVLRAHLERGGVVAHPTETVHGLAAALTPEGIATLRAIKGREPDRPFLLLLPAGEAGRPWRERLTWSTGARRLAERFWPGPLTLVLPAKDGCALPGITNPEGGIAVRESPHPTVRRITGLLGAPILSTSANRTGEAPAESHNRVQASFARELAAGTLLALDGPSGEGRVPSTLVACDEQGFRILREGAVTQAQIGRAWAGVRERS